MRNQLRGILWEQHPIPPPCPAEMLLHPFSLSHPQKNPTEEVDPPNLIFFFPPNLLGAGASLPCGAPAPLLVLILVDFGSGGVASQCPRGMWGWFFLG